MDNVCPEGTEHQHVTSIDGEALGSDIHVRHSECIRKYPQRYNPGFGATRDWMNDSVKSIVYMIQDVCLNRKVDMDGIILLLAEWDAEYCMDTPSTFHIRKSYVVKSQSHDPDNPTYMDALSGENAEEYFNTMDDEIQSIMGRDTWDIVSRKSVDDHNVLPGTWYLNCKKIPDWKIREFKARYCVRGDVQKRLSPKPLNLYYPVVQYATVMLMLVLQCILVL